MLVSVSTAVFFYFYAYKVNAHNPFILPISFVPLPFLTMPFFVLSRVGIFLSVYILYEVTLMTWVYGIFAAIISLVFYIRKNKRKKQGLDYYKNEQTPKRIIIVGCAIAGGHMLASLISTLITYL